MDKFKERKGNLQRLIVDIDSLKVNPLTSDVESFILNDRFEINDEIKKVIKISKNEYLDLEFIFIKTI